MHIPDIVDMLFDLDTDIPLFDIHMKDVGENAEVTRGHRLHKPDTFVDRIDKIRFITIDGFQYNRDIFGQSILAQFLYYLDEEALQVSSVASANGASHASDIHHLPVVFRHIDEVPEDGLDLISFLGTLM